MKHKPFPKQKYCIIRRVPFRLSHTGRIVWADVVAENIGGVSLLVVPKSQSDEDHSIVFAAEDVTDRVFVASQCAALDIGSVELVGLGKTLKFLGSKLLVDEITQMLQKDDHSKEF